MRRSSLKTPTGLLEYTITHRSRVTKRLHMELDEGGGLVVVAPQHWSMRHIRSTLSQNTSRVERFLIRARQQKLQPLQYVHGEQHFYLGTRYPLMIHTIESRQVGVIFSGKEIRIGIRPDNKDNTRAILQGWYHRQALIVFSERLQLIKQKACWTRDKSVPLKLRIMKRTWGNCSSKGVIKLNTHLIKAGLPVIDSVIAHELCHLLEMNHSKKFYALLEPLNPGWRQDREHLRMRGNVYLL